MEANAVVERNEEIQGPDDPCQEMGPGEVCLVVGDQVGTDGRIAAGSGLQKLQWTISKDKEFVLIMQGDGDLVLYRVVGDPPEQKGDKFLGQPVWSTNTAKPDKKGEFFAFQWPDGNLVVYGTSGWVWNSETHRIPGIAQAVEIAPLSAAPTGNLLLWKTQVVWKAKP
jgi:hypothetical protein